jgi:molybdopterin-guanine dinucleotide biosynthesis protein A
MINPKNNVNGYILAGGKSSRMGTDKGLIIINGKTIVKHVLEQLQPAVKDVVIVSNNPAYEKFGVKVIADDIKNIGPAGGIHSALNHTDTKQNFIVSCDMPFITTGAVKFIIKHALQSQITVPVYHEKTEPLFAVYPKECFTKWQKLIQKDIIKLQDIIIHFSFMKLNVDANPLFHDSFFTNINTPLDLKKAFKKLLDSN